MCISGSVHRTSLFLKIFYECLQDSFLLNAALHYMQPNSVIPSRSILFKQILAVMDGKNTAEGNTPTAHRGGENVNGMAGTEMGEVVRMTVQRGEGVHGIGIGRGAQL